MSGIAFFDYFDSSQVSPQFGFFQKPVFFFHISLHVTDECVRNEDCFTLLLCHNLSFKQDEIGLFLMMIHDISQLFRKPRAKTKTLACLEASAYIRK